MVKYARNGRLGRRFLSSVFGKSKRTDAECWALENFIVNMMSGCGWDCKGPYDLLMFRKEFLPVMTFRDILQRWFEGSNLEDGDGKWPIVEKHDGTPMWAWFANSMRISEWAPVNEDSPVTMKLVPSKNGFFKSVPL